MATTKRNQRCTNLSHMKLHFQIYFHSQVLINRMSTFTLLSHNMSFSIQIRENRNSGSHLNKSHGKFHFTPKVHMPSPETSKWKLRIAQEIRDEKSNAQTVMKKCGPLTCVLHNQIMLRVISVCTFACIYMENSILHSERTKLKHFNY